MADDDMSAAEGKSADADVKPAAETVTLKVLSSVRVLRDFM